MKIGIEAQRLFRTKKHGMDIVALELIKSLQEQDKENEYHILVKKDKDMGCLEIRNPKFTLHVLPSFPYPIWEQLLLPFYVWRLKLDLLHCTANTAPVYCPCKKVVTLHDIIFLEQNPIKGLGSSYQKLGNLYRKYVVPIVVKNCKRLFTVSHFEQQRILDYFRLKEEKVKVVYNGVGAHFFVQHSTEDKQMLRREYDLPDRYMLFLGNKDPKKNLPNVIRAYARYLKKSQEPLHLVVLDFPTPALARFVAREGLSKDLLQKIVSIGYVRNQKLPILIQASTLFLYPSLRESFGIPLLEAMACQVPVITSLTSSMPEVAGGCALLVNPESAEEIAQAMYKLQYDSTLRQTLVHDGFKRSQLFTWQASAIKSMQEYRGELES